MRRVRSLRMEMANRRPCCRNLALAHWLAHPEEGACCELYATIALIAGEGGTTIRPCICAVIIASVRRCREAPIATRTQAGRIAASPRRRELMGTSVGLLAIAGSSILG